MTPKDRVATHIKIPRDLLNEIDAVCEERIVGRAYLIERLLRRGLQHLPSVEPTAEVEPFMSDELIARAERRR